MKKLLIFICALFAVSTLSAQTYNVGDYYNVDGKKGVVFEVSEDGKHGKIISDELVSEATTWYKAMEWGKQLKDGWYLPSYEEMQVLLKSWEIVYAKMPVVGVVLWTTTEFDSNCAWMVTIKGDGRGALYKGNKFHVRPISKF